MTSERAHPDLPVAQLRPRGGPLWLWLIPLCAAAFAGYLGFQSWRHRGVEITVQLASGYGLQPGDEIRYRGIRVGRIGRVELGGVQDSVLVDATLDPKSAHLARAGTRIWVVRPQLGLTGVAGLETVIGPRYLALLPGKGPVQRYFIGLENPPLVESVKIGDLEIVLQSQRRSGLRPGASVLYRQVRVGTVLSVGLTSDGGAVEARVHVERPFAQLVRAGTRFWNVGGLRTEMGISGMSLEVESLETFISGGVALATPPDGGEVVRTGHRFELAGEADEDWLNWEPQVVIGSEFLPPGARMPTPLRAVLGWRQGILFKSDRSRLGWLLQTEHGILGPADLLVLDPDRDPENVSLDVSGQAVSLATQVDWTDRGLARRALELTQTPWMDSHCRVPETPEDCLAVTDPAAIPQPLAAARLTPDGEGHWRVDPAVAVDETQHGACVLSRRDGRLVGLLLVEEDGARVALLSNESLGQ